MIILTKRRKLCGFQLLKQTTRYMQTDKTTFFLTLFIADRGGCLRKNLQLTNPKEDTFRPISLRSEDNIKRKVFENANNPSSWHTWGQKDNLSCLLIKHAMYLRYCKIYGVLQDFWNKKLTFRFMKKRKQKLVLDYNEKFTTEIYCLVRLMKKMNYYLDCPIFYFWSHYTSRYLFICLCADTLVIIQQLFVVQ